MLPASTQIIVFDNHMSTCGLVCHDHCPEASRTSVVAIAVVAIVAIAVVAIAVAVVVATVAPHHGGHHVLCLGPHGGLSGLQVSFSTLESVCNLSDVINWSWLGMWSLLDRWRRTLFFNNTLQCKIGNGS
jgi:hypothetical protein